LDLMETHLLPKPQCCPLDRFFQRTQDTRAVSLSVLFADILHYIIAPEVVSIATLGLSELVALYVMRIVVGIGGKVTYLICRL
jgi:hypothetical protein